MVGRDCFLGCPGLALSGGFICCFGSGADDFLAGFIFFWFCDGGGGGRFSSL